MVIIYLNALLSLQKPLYFAILSAFIPNYCIHFSLGFKKKRPQSRLFGQHLVYILKYFSSYSIIYSDVCIYRSIYKQNIIQIICKKYGLFKFVKSFFLFLCVKILS